jgi:plastocyanin
MLRSVPRLAASAALLVLPLAACGGGSSASGGCGSASTTTPSITVHAQDSLKFDKTEYTAKAGDVTIQYVDDGSLVHTLLIKEKSGCKLQVSGRGDTKTGSVNLTPGTYTLYCDVPGHETAGMKATLTVS